MDAHLRLLLRRYLSTHSPDDATAFTEATARTNIEQVELWTVIFVSGFAENPTVINAQLSTSIFLTELDALRTAAEWVLDWVDVNEDRLGWTEDAINNHIRLPAYQIIESENLDVTEANSLILRIISQLSKFNIPASVQIISQRI